MSKKKPKTMRKRRPVVETVRQHCQHPDCKYRSTGGLQQTCDYLLMTKMVRGCKISECDKYEPDTGKKRDTRRIEVRRMEEMAEARELEEDYLEEAKATAEKFKCQL